MRHLVAILLWATAFVAAATDNSFCKANKKIVSRLQKDARAVTYCSRLLGVSTKTVTVTSASTPSPTIKITTVIVTDTVVRKTTTQVLKQKTTITPTATTITVTVTETETPTEIQTCLYQGSTQSSLAPRMTGLVDIGPLQEIDAARQPSFVRKLCSCLSLPTHTSTKIVHTTLPVKSVTKTSILHTTPTTILTTVITSKATTTAGQVTSTVTATETVTGFPVFELIPIGVRYAAFMHPFDSSNSNTGFTSSYFKNNDPFHTGRIENMDFNSTRTPPYEVDLDDGYPIPDASNLGMVMQGYFIAKQSGLHTFSTSKDLIDNWAYVWVGDVAYQDWDDTNTNYKATHLGTDPSKWTDGSFSLNLTNGDALPLTYLFANGGGTAASNIQVTTPDGSTVSDTTGLFAPPCAFGSFPPE